MPDTKALFDKISNNYDLLNTIFSAGIDKLWRKNLVRKIDPGSFVLESDHVLWAAFHKCYKWCT